MNKVLLASVALNVFLAAFVLGRMSVLPQGDSMPSPAGMQTALRNGPPPPPMFGPQELFGEDMKDNFKEVQAHFEKVQTLRQEFAQDLMKGKVTEEQAAQHLAAIDAEMDGVKKSVQGKAAKKIADMPDEKRIAFAKRLMEKAPPPPDDRRGPPPELRGPPPDMDRGPPPDHDRGPPPQDGQIPGDFDMGTPPPPPRE
ncbi:MAG: hypothetical protein PSY14_14220 [bacterium]|nr:hypothetical protein [bacterium]